MKTKLIRISEIAKNRLAKFGYKLSSWDTIINELMNHAEKCDKYWSDRN